MNFTINTEILKQTTQIHGKNIENIVCMEECAELQKAISKLMRYGESKKLIDNLTEEIADTILSIAHLQEIYNISDKDIQIGINQKLQRQKVRNTANIAQKHIIASGTIIAYDIEWDVSDNDPNETPEQLGLPKTAVIPDGLTDPDEISDYLSNTYGFCHKGFKITKD